MLAHPIFRKLATLCSALVVCLPVSLVAKLDLASPFTNHMVLQRNMDVPVWGSADPGLTITVKFAGQTKTSRTDTNGNWRVDLDPLAKNADPQTMTVIAGKDQETIELVDVLVGEVWICSGQSNMQMKLGAVRNIQALESNTAHIRSFEVETIVALEEQDRCKGEWSVNRPDSAVAAAFAHYLEDYADMPIGILLSSWGSSSIEAWMPRDMTATVPHFKTIMNDFDKNSGNKQKIVDILTILESGEPWDKHQHYFLRHQPNVIYNAMMKPLAPYACRGMVWYQGERNTEAINEMPDGPWNARVAGMQLYDDVMEAWIQRYRKEWENPEMHLLVVMLPGFGKLLDAQPEQTHESPDALSWAWMRESQLNALAIPHTSVANTIDLGHLTNIHPKDKLPIGKRLATIAARDTLGKDIVAYGPMMESIQPRGHNIVIHFTHAEGLQTTDGKAPTGFWLLDNDDVWHPAQSQIQGKTVVLYSPAVNRPRHVRYAFAGMPEVNLVNAANLPAYPFRSDDLPPQ
ncbi:MAG: sialate O-acetylesterase [Opitutaceae bacterium]